MNRNPADIIVVVRGAGELASGIIRRLTVAGFRVIALEKERPECIRRAVCFADAVFDGEKRVEGITARLAKTEEEVFKIINEGEVPIFVDPEGEFLKTRPAFLIDGRMLKRGIDTTIDSAGIVIGLGPGFTAGQNCHAAVETNRGNDLGRVLYEGSPRADTGIPGEMMGISIDRVIRAPSEGVFESTRQIGDTVKADEQIGRISGRPVMGKIDGVLRGLIRNGAGVCRNQKIGDIDPSGIRENCFRISDKANAVAGGVLEAILALAGPPK